MTTTPDTTTSPVISKGEARGGVVAAIEALKLWGRCAEGGADYSNLSFINVGAFVRLKAAKAGFAAAVEVLADWNADCNSSLQNRWRVSARDTLTKAAGHLLAACREVEGSNQARASFKKHGDNEIADAVFEWEGTSTQGRRIRIEIHFNDEMITYLYWDTATGQESSYLGLPSMTDEADDAGRRQGGWERRWAK